LDWEKLKKMQKIKGSGRHNGVEERRAAVNKGQQSDKRGNLCPYSSPKTGRVAQAMGAATRTPESKKKTARTLKTARVEKAPRVG